MRTANSTSTSDWDLDDASWRVAVAALLPRRGVWRLLGGLLGLSAGAASLAPAGAKKCKPKCKGKVCGPDGCKAHCGKCAAGATCSRQGKCICQPACGPGFTCSAKGVCQCIGKKICSGVCCARGQVCNAANTCCTPEGREATCTDHRGKLCGQRLNNCDQTVNCGGCEEQYCHTWVCKSDNTCEYTQEQSGLPGNLCDAPNHCCDGACCIPPPD
jgi:hypothetical protein